MASGRLSSRRRAAAAASVYIETDDEDAAPISSLVGGEQTTVEAESVGGEDDGFVQTDAHKEGSDPEPQAASSGGSIETAAEEPLSLERQTKEAEKERPDSDWAEEPDEVDDEPDDDDDFDQQDDESDYEDEFVSKPKAKATKTAVRAKENTAPRRSIAKKVSKVKSSKVSASPPKKPKITKKPSSGVTPSGGPKRAPAKVGSGIPLKPGISIPAVGNLVSSTRRRGGLSKSAKVKPLHPRLSGR